MAERQVDDVDAELGAVGHREVDRADDVARVAGAVLVEHLQHDEASRSAPGRGSRCSTTARPIRRWCRRRACRARSRRRRHGATCRRREVVERRDAALELRRHLEARVDDGDADAAPGPLRVLQAQRVAHAGSDTRSGPTRRRWRGGAPDRRRSADPPVRPVTVPSRPPISPVGRTTWSAAMFSTSGYEASTEQVLDRHERRERLDAGVVRNHGAPQAAQQALQRRPLPRLAW